MGECTDIQMCEIMCECAGLKLTAMQIIYMVKRIIYKILIVIIISTAMLTMLLLFLGFLFRDMLFGFFLSDGFLLGRRGFYRFFYDWLNRTFIGRILT